jgi:pSer/pThr/pTyr-binding forkhead associated (FHA) protein
MDVEAAVAELRWHEFVPRASRMPTPTAISAASSESTDWAAATHPEIEKSPVIARLLVVHDGQTVAERQLTPGRFIIGRTTDNDLQIDSKYVSRHHCQIISTPEGSVIEDLNSTNGVFVKQKRVRKHNLNDGDVVLVGRHELMYIDERAPKSHSGVETSDTPVPSVEEEQGKGSKAAGAAADHSREL